MASILIVDDDKGIRKQLFWHLTDEFEVVEADSPTKAKQIIQQQEFNVALLDMHMPYEGENEKPAGLFVLDLIRKNNPDTLCIVMTGDRDPQISLKVIEAGAWDIFMKPVDLNELSIVLKRAIRVGELVNQNKTLKLSKPIDPDSKIIGDSLEIKKVLDLINQVGPSNASILIHGESGTGKELIAQAIHQKSNRKQKAFIAVNCAALTDSLVEDELFGHDSGAYTGAKGSRKGKFELADQGTLFLDEIAELSSTAQGKLLRVLQEGTLERLGSEKTVKIDVRVLAATHQDLKKRVKEGQFREDLYYRLMVIPFDAPPLRNRKSDIRLLANHFLMTFRKQLNRGPQSFSEEAILALQHYEWPGNVRELKNIVERLTILVSQTHIDLKDLPVELRTNTSSSPIFEADYLGYKDGKSYEELINEYRKIILEQVLEQSSSKAQAAQKLGINRSYLYELMDKLGLTSA